MRPLAQHRGEAEADVDRERDVTSAGHEEEQPRTAHRGMSAGERLAIVHEIAEQLASARDVKEVVDVVRSRLREALRADVVSLALVADDGRSLDFLLAEGFAATSEPLLQSPLHFDESMPVWSVLHGPGPVLWRSLADRDREFPEFASYPSDCQAWALLPLAVHDDAIGVMSFGWKATYDYTPDDVAFLQVLTHQCAIALDRARLEEARLTERETLELLSEGTRLMVSALEPQRVLDSLVRLGAERVAPWVAVYVVEGAMMRRVALEFAGESELAARLRTEPPIALSANPLMARVVQTGEMEVVVDAGFEVLNLAYPDIDFTAMLRARSAWSVLIVPVKFAGQVIGVLGFASTEWHGTPPPQVLFAAEGLAGRAGVALTNARRFQHERETAATLTEALVPSGWPAVPGFEVAARYLPAGAPVAGDWFDVSELPTGRFLVGVGDAGGHGLRAASLMAQLRNAARGIAIGEHSPSEILGGLRLLTLQDGDDNFATALYGLLEPATGRFVWASAGHPTPLVFSAGHAVYADGPVDPPFGWPTGSPTEQTVDLGPGSGVVLVTDGVLERRGGDIATRMAGLAKLVGERAELHAEGIAAQVVSRMCQTPEDDCCVVVVKRC